MLEENYPALYRAADKASYEAQASLLSCYKISTTFLIFAVMTSQEDANNHCQAIISAICFVISLLAFAYSKYQKYREVWYQARALAESVKTVSWRFMMSAEPFKDVDEETNIEEFRNLLTELLKENKGIGTHLSGEISQHDEITERMVRILRMPFVEKKQIYLEERIDNQRTWYAKKSGDNRKYSRFFYWCTFLAYFAAIVFLIARVIKPEITFLPVDILAIIASGLIGWTEIRRFDELISAYGLTAHEVGIIKSRFKSVNDIDHLSAFVKDAENAFSREHTQWAARRDV